MNEVHPSVDLILKIRDLTLYRLKSFVDQLESFVDQLESFVEFLFHWLEPFLNFQA
jgi:hypothetical protein